jgi:hypothetical protein
MSPMLKLDYYARAQAGDLQGTYRLFCIITNEPKEYISNTSVYGVSHVSVYVTVDNRIALFDYKKAALTVLEYYLEYRGTEHELCYSPDLKRVGPFWDMSGKFPWLWATYDIALEPAWRPPFPRAFAFGCLPICTLKNTYETLKDEGDGMTALYANWIDKR